MGMNFRALAIGILFVIPGIFQNVHADAVLTVPQDLASLSSSYLPDPSSLPDYILIQDVHRHAEVQGKIANLILFGYSHWGARRIFMEGAFSKVDLTVFHRLPDDARETLLKRLILEGNLSGPELAAVMVLEREWRDPPVWPLQLVGMEDARLYSENLYVFRDLLHQREAALRELDSLIRLNDEMHLPQPNILGNELSLAKSLLELKLTPEEYSLYLSARSALPNSPQLEPALTLADKFYDVVNQRSMAFIKESSRKLPAGSGPRVLVVGGFYTAFMAQQLREAGLSFVVLSPTITQSENHQAYEKQLLDSVDTLDFSRTP
jgi:hypothetical protein